MADVAVRSHRPAISSAPNSNSTQGSVRARRSTAHIGSTWYESMAMANSAQGSFSLVHAA